MIWDTVSCNETNSILNPIEFSQYRNIIDEIEKKGLEEAEKQGIYRKNMQILVTTNYGKYFLPYALCFNIIKNR